MLYTSTVSVSCGSPLLKQLHCSMLGGGGFLHVDNIRTLATSEACLQAQLTHDFTTSNFLQLKLNKCEISKDQQVAVPTREVEQVAVSTCEVEQVAGPTREVDGW